MSFLLSCPHCGPRPVDEFAYFGEVTRRPERSENGSPSLRELTEYVYFRDNVAGPQREWWQHRDGCGEWFLAERDTRTNEVLSVTLPEPRPTQLMRLAAAARRADRPRATRRLPLRREADRGLRGRHVRLRALRGRPADVLALVQVPPAARAALLHRPLPELHDGGGRRAERPRLRRAAARGRVGRRRRTCRHARPRPRSRVVDKVGGPFTPVGFYYRTMIRPRRRGRCTRRSCATSPASGASTSAGGHSRRYDVEHRRARVLVVGGGGRPRGRARRGGRGPGVVLVDEGPRPLGGAGRCRGARRPARALGIYEGGLVPVDCRNRAATATGRERIVVATGARRAAARVPGQRPGRRDAARARSARLIHDFSLRPGERAVVLAADEPGSRSPTTCARRASQFSASSTCARRRARARGAASARPRPSAGRRRTRRSRATSSSPREGASPRTRCSPRRARASSTTPRSGFRPDDAPAGRRGGRDGHGRGARRGSTSRPSTRAGASASCASART